MLRRTWPRRPDGWATPVWQSRGGGVPDGIAWNLPDEDYAGPALAGGVVVHLAGGRIDAAGAVALALAVCDLALQQGARHVLLASSSAVYGAGDGGAEGGLSEDSPLKPLNAYGAGKAAMEDAVRDWSAAHGADAPGVTCLRIGNVLGSDALIGRAVPGVPVTLDPVPGQAGGPVRSYIGPSGFAEAVARLCQRALDGNGLPEVLNLAAAPPVAMGDLLDAAGLQWSFGPAAPDVVGRVVLDVTRMAILVGTDVAVATPASMAAEWRGLAGTGA